MGHKTCAVLNAIISVDLFYRLVVIGAVPELHTFGSAIILFAVVAVGCWKQWRWLVALGGVPIILAAVATFVLANAYNTSFHTNEMGFVNLFAMFVGTLEIVSFVCARQEPARLESSDESGTSE